MVTQTSTPALDRSELIGVWGFDHGYRVNPVETRISFAADGSGVILNGSERIPLTWRLEGSGLEFRVSDRWLGPFRLNIAERQLPLGRFTSLVSEAALLPFGLRQFQRISTTPTT
jgi:hypothetical protein